jgi:hypothetical protein
MSTLQFHFSFIFGNPLSCDLHDILLSLPITREMFEKKVLWSWKVETGEIQDLFVPELPGKEL